MNGYRAGTGQYRAVPGGTGRYRTETGQVPGGAAEKRVNGGNYWRENELTVISA